jgi:hypothetical protein
MAIITAITGTMVTTLVVMRIVTGIAGRENKPDGDVGLHLLADFRAAGNGRPIFFSEAG